MSDQGEPRASQGPPPSPDVGPPGSEDVAPPSAPPASEEAPPLSGQVDDADDLRAFHFRRLLRKKLTWILSGLFVIAAGIAGGAIAGPAIAGIAGAAAILLSLLIVFGLADSASEDAFFDIYAKQRGMTREEGGGLPPVTELLRKGDERKCSEILRGPLEDPVQGALALYTYTEVYHDKNGRHETDYNFTVAIVNLPDTLKLIEELYCRRKSGLKVLEGVEDAFRSKERVHLESEALDDKYEIFVAKSQDPNWVHQLFSPTFIVWLTDSTPEKFAFELESGVLCCNVRGHKKSAKDLDAMRAAAAHVAVRLEEEVLE